MGGRARGEVRNWFGVRCIVGGIDVGRGEIGYVVVVVGGSGKGMYEGGEEWEGGLLV